MRGLAALQGVVLGDGPEYDSFPGSIRALHTLIIAQISDLRSTLCKEACRTVATLAKKMGPAFVDVAGLFIPSLIKQACVKTQIMSSAAYRCLLVRSNSNSD